MDTPDVTVSINGGPQIPLADVREVLDKAKGKARAKKPALKDTPADKAVADKALGTAAQELRSFIGRWEACEADRKDAVEGQKDIMAEAKGRGYDTAAIRRVIRFRAMKPEQREKEAELEALVELYKDAVGLG